MKNKKKAFTLIELMIVIAIIAILAAVLVPNFIRAQRQGRLSACEANLKNISTALEMYAVDYDGLYPPAGSISAFVQTYLNNRPPQCPAARAVYKYDIANAGTGNNEYDVSCPDVTAHALGLQVLYFSPADGLVKSASGTQPTGSTDIQ